MTDTPRRPLVAGNWKMHPADRGAAVGLATAVAEHTAPLIAEEAVDVVVCPPVIWIREVAAALDGTGVGIGAQTMHPDDEGAFTGEISPRMLDGLARYVIVGHSERRRLFGETDADVAAKVASAVTHGMVPIAAVGETGDERRAGETATVVARQVRAAISRIDRVAGSRLVVAYEPGWAIGTGDAASGDDAQAGAALVRAILAETDSAGSDETRVLYGGSVAPELAADYFSQADVDGALVGGASLEARAFAAIVRAAAS
jgi:triosephosphate isomerase